MSLRRSLRTPKQWLNAYRKLTGRPLGITSEVAEYEAARLLGLRSPDPRQEGYDAVRETGEIVRRLQFSSRASFKGYMRTLASLGNSGHLALTEALANSEW